MKEILSNAMGLNERKKILIVEDEQINREILEMVLQDEYDLVSAESGGEALNALSEQGSRLSLMLLDLNLPDMHGIDIMNRMKGEEDFENLPIIVLTADREAEVESLTAGAMDFIPKPYPRPEVIIARIKRTIELFERRSIIDQTERDSLTGLYNREYFFRYADRFDKAHEDMEMDAIVLDINHFHLINERYGKHYADEVLKRIGQRLLTVLKERSGIACRRDADTFFVYCPHMENHTEFIDMVSQGIAGDGMADNVVRLRMGVYPGVDKSIDIERRVDRAKLAADTVRNSFAKTVAIYDSALQEAAIFAEQLLVDFPKAMEEKQFKVYYQPKYNIRGEEPVLNSAEALVRWEHPEFGLISPGMFIPLFEENGIIQQLDCYVWKEAARQMKEWREKFGVTIPVSVNVSRVDMFDPELVELLKNLVSEAGLSDDELLLEITESAYTDNSDYIIKTVEEFRKTGFFIEMDDFGSGYSSLNMLANLPIDALKLDMYFIRNAFKNKKNIRILEIVIDIAEMLGVPVIAEGVETEEQLTALKSMGCDIVQGYYFSKPVPPEEFEKFIIK